MTVFFSGLMSYLIGCINPAFIVGKIRGFDIRTRGSGNAGASNAIIVMGKKVGFFSMFFDIVKAFAAVKLARFLFPATFLAWEVAGACCILGHIFPFYMGFHGGKGLACLGGVILAYQPLLFLALLIFELILALILDYICVVPITASVIFTLIYLFSTGNIWGTLLFAAVSLVMILKHRENLERIKNGTEAHFSFLWKREEEIERVENNRGK